MSRRSILLRSAVATLSVSALSPLTGVVAPAGAENLTARVVLGDATGDVWSIAEGENAELTQEGDEPTADVERAVVRHGRYRVVVRMRFTNLRRLEPQSYIATIVSRGDYGALFLSAGPRRWKGRHVLVDEQFGRVKCEGLRHTIGYDTDRVRVAIPRNCIDRPAWVRVELSNYMFRGETEGELREITDNPHSSGHAASLTERLYRDAS